jgi:hypothetical protein
MSATHKYLCGQCAAEAVSEKDRLARLRDGHTGRRSGRLPLVLGGLFVVALLLKQIGIGLIVLPVAFFLLVKNMFGGRRDVFSPRRRTPHRKIFSAKKDEDITPEQLAALFRIGGGRVTATKLALAADASVKTAKKFLDKQVVDGVLDVEAGDSELIYIKK